MVMVMVVALFEFETHRYLLFHLSKTKTFGFPDSKVHGAIIGPTWVLSSPGGPHVGPMNLAIWFNTLKPVGTYMVNEMGYQ